MAKPMESKPDSPKDPVKTFEDIKRVLSANRNVMFKFYSPACRPCKDYDEMIARYQAEAGALDVMICSINAQEAPELVSIFKVSSVPYSLVLDNEGRMKDSLLGFPSRKAFADFLAKNYSS